VKKKNPIAVKLGKLRQKKKRLTSQEASVLGKLSAQKRWGTPIEEKTATKTS